MTLIKNANEAKSLLKIGTRLKFDGYPTVWVVQSIEERGPVITLRDGSHKDLFDWGMFAESNAQIIA